MSKEGVREGGNIGCLNVIHRVQGILSRYRGESKYHSYDDMHIDALSALTATVDVLEIMEDRLREVEKKAGLR